MTENQNKKKSRPSRLRLYFAPALLLALSLALSVGWVMISHRVEAHLDRMIADEASKGRLWTCANRNIAGFPFRIEIECLDAQVKVANEPHFDVKLPRIIAVAQIYDPRLVIIEAQGPLSIVASDKPAVSASWSSLRSSIHMQSDQMPDRLSIVGDSLTLKNEMRGQSVAITHGELQFDVSPCISSYSLWASMGTSQNAGIATVSSALVGRLACPPRGNLRGLAREVF